MMRRDLLNSASAFTVGEKHQDANGQLGLRRKNNNFIASREQSWLKILWLFTQAVMEPVILGGGIDQVLYLFS